MWGWGFPVSSVPNIINVCPVYQNITSVIGVVLNLHVINKDRGDNIKKRFHPNDDDTKF